MISATSSIPWELDLESCCYTYVGKQAEAVFGYPVERWYEPGFWEEHLYPEDSDWAKLVCTDNHDTLEDHAFDCRLISADGEIVWIHNEVLVNEENGQPVSLSGFMWDITEVKEREEEILATQKELQRANQRLEAFTHSVSHDLKAPLRQLRSWTTMLSDKLAESPVDGFSSIIRGVNKASSRMTDIVDSLLALSNINQHSFTKETFSLTDLVRKSFKALEENYPDRKVKLHLQEGMQITGERKLIAVMIDNILGNAWKYTSQNQDASIRVNSSIINGKTTYCIKDNGVGFPEEMSGQLFEPFKRFHRSSDFEGSGIGLSTVKKIVELHGGKIWAEGRPEAGAAFYFTFE